MKNLYFLQMKKRKKVKWRKFRQESAYPPGCGTRGVVLLGGGCGWGFDRPTNCQNCQYLLGCIKEKAKS